MEEKEKSNKDESPKEENKTRDKIINNTQDAGPSRIVNLPGAIQHSPRNVITGRSKSEHSIKPYITSADVANALKITSLSFGNQNQTTDRELKIPMLDKNDDKDDTITFIELKKLMASCFKISKDTNEIANVNVHTAISGITNDLVHSIPNVSLNKADINDVVVTQDSRSNKAPESRKKNSGNLSEKSDLLAQRDSLSSIGSNVCRICMTRGKERLISPCNCKGSLANVHLSCLQRWLNQVGRNHCELCGFSYPAIRTPRYTVLQALRLWFCNPRNRSHLQTDCLIFWLLSTVTAGLLAVCIVGTQYFMIEGNNFGKLDAARNEGLSHRITETAMDFFMGIVLCGYTVTVYFLWKDHYVMWNRWRRANVNVQLLLSPDSNPVPFVPRSRYNIV
ncbi:unnamed protein product [Danaus chrysippus]|uniref:(African queen) hypothetical protein n=1 Tax=Danaus chrysippus TaxID=151541 RepID=A0A8J2QSW3_9NEOP|nr:unnamed protein product [Danaus chrysippus]